jgi:hypothetical protein
MATRLANAFSADYEGAFSREIDHDTGTFCLENCDATLQVS